MRGTAIALALAAACGGDGKGDRTGDDDDTSVGDDDDTSVGDDDDTSVGDDDDDTLPSGPAWYGEVEPVVRENCVRCHQQAGIAPFRLDAYADAALWSEAMKDAVVSRRMPPWLVRDDGTCSEWKDSEALSQEEIDLLAAWADGGAREGDPADAVTDPLPALPALDRVDLTLTTPELVPDASGSSYGPNDEYRCFLFDDPTAADRFLTGFEIGPGNAAIVHHVLGMVVDPAGRGYDGRRNDAAIAELEAEDDRPGWECFGTVGGYAREEGVPVTWAPGMGAVRYPQDVGVRVGADDWFVVQIHYNLADPAHHGESDTTDVKLRFEDAVPKEAVFALPDDLLFSIFYGAPVSLPPGEPAYDFTFEYSAADLAFLAQSLPRGGDIEVYGAMPHMHGYGRQQTLTLVDDATGAETCLVDVPRWDYGWQKFYFFEEPLVASLRDRFRISCTYDTSAATAPVEAGWGTQDEMCLMVLMLVP